jgi:hypothetical protein
MPATSEIDNTHIVNISLMHWMCKFIYICRIHTHHTEVMLFRCIIVLNTTIYEADFSLTFKKYTP